MPTKQAQRAEINSFVQGLITEASPLNFPENASADEENFVLNRDGSRERRLGMDLENNHEWLDSGITKEDIDKFGFNTFNWTEVEGEVETEFLVVQFDNRLYFFDVESSSISREGYKGLLGIPEFPIHTDFSFANIEGNLVVVAGADRFAVVSYKDDRFTYYLDRIMIRDVFGLENSGYKNFDDDISYRGRLLPFTHYYNLQNQSWGITKRAEVQIGNAVNTWDIDPILYYTRYYGLTPSNSEQVWLGMQYSPPQYNGETNKMDRPYEYMYANLYKESWGSTIPPAKGYFIIDALRRGASRREKFYANIAKYPELNKDPMNGFATFFPEDEIIFPQDFTPHGPRCVTEFSGRVFYSGFTGDVIDGDAKSPNYTNYVFFSKMVRNKTDIGKCYQEGDPTSRESNDIVDTDGGFLRISEAKEIHTMISLGSSLIVIATNGVWSISGGSDYGFTATNYKVTKLSTFGGLSISTVVTEGSRVYFWAADGIYTIGHNQMGDISVESLTLNTIQTLYDSIPTSSKREATGVYDNFAKKIRWVYQDGEKFSPDTNTYELVLDAEIGAFSKSRIRNLDTNYVNLLSVFQANPFKATSTENFVLVSGSIVEVGDDPVIVTRREINTGFQETKYVVGNLFNGKLYFSFSFYNNVNFIDWQAVDGVGADAKAYCLTGAQTVGDSGVDKQIPYLFMHFIRTEDTVDNNWVPKNQSSCLFRCQWNFANSVNSKQWTPLMQAYRYRKAHWASEPNGVYDNGYSVLTSKNKIRGKGKAFAMYFETEPGKDCKILGWNLTINGNSIT